MSSRYAVGGKRRSSMVHADRTWTCLCGRKVRGNGGKSSHKRACPTFQLAEVNWADRQREQADRRRQCPEGRAR